LTGAEGSYPVGDLNWYPDKKAEWILDPTNNTKQPSYNSNDIVVNDIFPNPFNEQIRINFQLKNSTSIDISIYDFNGNLVTTLFCGRKNAGNHSIDWKTSNDINTNLSTGIYFYQIKTNKSVATGKIQYIK
jgi:hypothetical protein